MKLLKDTSMANFPVSMYQTAASTSQGVNSQSRFRQAKKSLPVRL